jgi:ELWxxDGT repeat protein
LLRLAALSLALAPFGPGAAAQEPPTPLADVNPGPASSAVADAIAIDGTVYFVADNPSYGRELWKTDGTPQGTVLVADIQPGPASSNPRMLRRLWTNVLFVADDGVTGPELWRSNGTGEGTARVTDIVGGPQGSEIDSLTPINASLAVFRACDARGCELWRTDGYSAQIVRDLRPGPAGSNPTALTLFGSRVYFAADDGVGGTELWRSDGFSVTLVKDIDPRPADPSGVGHSNPELLLGGFGTHMYFRANDGVHGAELWRTDGTPAGTHLVADMTPGAEPTTLHSLTWYGSARLFFAAESPQLPPALMTTDGTPGGTQLVKEMSVAPGTLMNARGTLYLGGSTDGSDTELWKSDGTPDGTVPVLDLNPGGPSHPAAITDTDGGIYFIAGEPSTGRELWRTNGTVAGTARMTDLHPAGDGVHGLTAWGYLAPRLFLVADDGQAGAEPWIYTPNLRPVANAGPDGHVRPGNDATLDGSASSDPEGDTLAFSWQDAAGNALGDTPVITVSQLPLGTHTFTLTVFDGAGLSATDEVVVTVADTRTLRLELGSVENGYGSVFVDPPGEYCFNSPPQPGVCEYFLAPNTVVRLEAQQYTPGSIFIGWAGACTGTGPCEVVLSDDVVVTASFRGPQRLEVVPDSFEYGYGSIRTVPHDNYCPGSPGMPAPCAYWYDVGTVVTLEALPSIPGSIFIGWGGACSGLAPTCQVTMENATQVTATFRGPQRLEVVADSFEYGYGSIRTVPYDNYCPGSPGMPASCAYWHQVGTVVTLEALPSIPGSIFIGWSGACSGLAPTCQVTMENATQVTATFRGPQRLEVVADSFEYGYGSIRTVPYDNYCAGAPGMPVSCAYWHQVGTVVTLEALPSMPGSIFIGWGGACSGLAPTCQVTVENAAQVTATFRGPQMLEVVATGIEGGTGIVTAAPYGQTCANTPGGPQACPSQYPVGTVVTLTAQQSPDAIFLGWTGACTGLGPCEVTVDGPKQVTATFRGPQLLDLIVIGVQNGSGNVTATPPGASCLNAPGATLGCPRQYAVGTLVTLTAIPSGDSVFLGWGGACAGVAECQVAMDGVKQVTASFRGPETLELTVASLENGAGRVDLSGGACENTPGSPQVCTFPFAPGTVVSFDPIPNPGSVFAGWSGACTGIGSCQVTMDQLRQVTATFRGPQTLQVRLEGPDGGSGSVLVQGPDNQLCESTPGTPQTCNFLYRVGTPVHLQALGLQGSTFLGWSGACTGTDPCDVTLDGPRQVTATFRGPQTLEVTVTGVDGGFGQVVYQGGYCENTPGTSQTCASLHAVGASLVLDVMVPEGHVFVGWSGACTVAPCVVLMDQARHVTATFRGPQALEVTVTGVDGGFGQVVYPGGYCENTPGTSQTCASLHGVGAVVTLDTMVPEGHAFAGWSGACAGTGPCQVTMDQARQVTATFRGPQTLSVTVTGIDSGVGFVTFAGNSCDNWPAATITCTYLQPVGQLVTLQATPAEGTDSLFVGWSGACTGTGPCQVTMDQARAVTATFRGPQRLTVTVVSLDGYEAARVQVTGGPDCQAAPNTTQTCYYLFPHGAPVTVGYLAPVPMTTWGFEGWSGDCTGIGGCGLTMDASRNVTATFRGPQVLTLTVSAADTGIGYVEVEQGGSPRQTCSNQGGWPQPCVYPFGLGEVVTLTPVTGMFSVFVGWSGACTGTGPCQVTMSQSTSVSAVFAHENQAPTASAGGPYSGVRNQPVTFAGSGWDWEGDALTYSWDFGDGSTGTGPSPMHAYATLGTFTVTLTVHDGQLPSAPSSTTVTITNRTPTANAGGPYTGVRNQAVAFNGSGSDPDGDPLIYAWDFGDGSTGSGATPTHAYAALGTFTVTLTVSDGQGGSAQATSSATITNRAPTASAGGPYSGFRNTAIAFNGSGSSDPDGDPLTYSWDFGDGSTGTGANPTYAYATLGTFTVTLVVSDGHVSSAPATTTVTIANCLPIANAGPDRTVLHRTSVTLDGRASSDPDGTIVGYLWSQLSGPAVTLSGASTSVATFTAPKVSPGQTVVLVFQLRVTDNDGATATDQVTITVTR